MRPIFIFEAWGDLHFINVTQCATLAKSIRYS